MCRLEFSVCVCGHRGGGTGGGKNVAVEFHIHDTGTNHV